MIIDSFDTHKLFSEKEKEELEKKDGCVASICSLSTVIEGNTGTLGGLVMSIKKSSKKDIAALAANMDTISSILLDYVKENVSCAEDMLDEIDPKDVANHIESLVAEGRVISLDDSKTELSKKEEDSVKKLINED